MCLCIANKCHGIVVANDNKKNVNLIDLPGNHIDEKHIINVFYAFNGLIELS